MVDYPKSVNKKITEKILYQMNNIFYKINNNDENIGFFCKIKYKTKVIPVLITNKYMKEMEDSILINNNTGKIELIDILYRNKDYSLTVIKIKENKSIKYIEIDDKVYENESEMKYNKESIYILQYMKDISVAYGIIKEINKDDIIYTGNINSKYSLIFNLSNNKLIGIHKNNSIYYNYGLFFKSIIKDYEFKHKYYKTINNEINILMEIDKKDINQEIYFLDNYENQDNGDKIHTHDNFKELNEFNTELYINNEVKDYQKYFKPEKEGIYNIRLIFNIKLNDCSYMFAGCKNIIKINFNLFNSKNVKNMKYMFYDCENLKILNLLSFNSKNVTNMESLFKNCKSLSNLDLHSFDIENVINMSNMFNNCISLQNLNLFSFKDTNVINMSYMFYNCSNLINLDLSSLKIKKDINMGRMLYNCNNYENLDLSWYKSNNIDTNHIFYNNIMTVIYSINKTEKEIRLFGNNFALYNEDNCYLLIEGEKHGLCSLWKLNKNQKEKNTLKIQLLEFRPIINMSHIFNGCSLLKSLPDISKWDTKNVTNMSHMFDGCSSLKSLPDISGWDTKNVTNMSYMFYGCSLLKSLPDISKWDTKKVTNKMFMVSGCYANNIPSEFI